MTYQPFYFAWVSEDEAIFDPVLHARFDEEVLSVEVGHDEGQYPTLDITIKNPRIGLLNPSRNVWAWLAYNPINGGQPVPLVFAVLIGIPTDLFQEVITLKLIAQPPNYIEDKQAVAETLKVRPFYDPIWLEESKRDEPDAILEGYSALYHIDRVTLQTSVSDILTGEDGTIDFPESVVFYDSVKMELGEAPLTDIQVQATVSWTQHWWGIVPGPNINIESYSGGTFYSEWPKAGSSFGGGWRIEESFIRDNYMTDITPMANIEWVHHVVDPGAEDCSILDGSGSASIPALMGPSFGGLVSWKEHIGLCDPPNMVKNPSSETNGIVVPLWSLTGTWTFRYEANREFNEYLVMDITANTQSIFTSPKLQQHTEVMKINGSNVGQPIVVYDAWSDFLGSPVAVGDTIYPNDPTKPGGTSYQICVVAGTAGITEPSFSDTPGVITIDGTVQWASLGDSPLQEQPDWAADIGVATGEIIGYVHRAFDKNTGQLEEDGQFTYLLALSGGFTNAIPVTVTWIPPIAGNDAVPEAPRKLFFVLGPSIPGKGNIVGDGTVSWLDLGPDPNFLQSPNGGNKARDPARCFFPTDRGQQSVEYLIAKARARLRMRSRAVKIIFEVPFEHGLTLTCRQDATIHDPRIPGGQATGKIIAYKLKSKDGKNTAEIHIGVAVGLDGTVVGIAGTPVYVNEGYVQVGYQQYTGGFQTLLNGSDILYTPPTFAPFDDGLIFPLQKLPILAQGQSGSAAEQLPLLQAALLAEVALARQQAHFPHIGPAATYAWAEEMIERGYFTSLIPYVLQANPVAFMLELPNLQGGPFYGAYTVFCTPLEIPKGVDLSAPSSP